MKYFAIRQKKTGFFLPQSDRTVRAGHTHSEPTDPKKLPPRLFTREGPAKCALTWWLKGVHNEDYGIDEDFYGHDYKYQKGPTDPVEGTARDPESMEVVPITVTFSEEANAPK